MNRRNQIPTLAVTLILTLILPCLVAAQTQTPDPNQSTFPGHFLVCPSGDTSSGIVLRDVNGQPCIIYPVTVQFFPANFNPLCVMPGPPFPLQPTTTDLAGNLSIAMFMGGYAPNGAAIIIDGVTGLTLAAIPRRRSLLQIPAARTA